MKIAIESTPRVIAVKASDKSDPVLCRVWEGVTSSGIKVQVLVPRIAALATEDLTRFDAELLETRAPSAEVEAFPLRMIL